MSFFIIVIIITFVRALYNVHNMEMQIMLGMLISAHLVDKHPVLVVGDISRADVLFPHFQHLIIRHALRTKNIFYNDYGNISLSVYTRRNFATYIILLYTLISTNFFVLY